MSASGARLPIAPEKRGDGAYPAGASAMLGVLLRLASEDDGERHLLAAEALLGAQARQLQVQPEQWPAMLAHALDLRPAALARHGGDAPPFEVPDSGRHVSAEARLVRVAGQRRIIVRLHIAPRFHINANPASHDHLIATTLRLDGIEPAQISYP